MGTSGGTETIGTMATREKSLLTELSWCELEHLVRAQQRNREVHTPPISAFRWWARRSHALIGALLDQAKDAAGGHLTVADPFSGGGTVAVEAARRELDVYAQDLHPWAVAGLRAALTPVDTEELERASRKLLTALAPVRTELYGTVCPVHGADAEVLTAFWVRVAHCPDCAREVFLYPYSLVTRASRQSDEPSAWWGCQACGGVTKGEYPRGSGACTHCDASLALHDKPLLPGRIATCPHDGCGESFDAFAKASRFKLALVQRSCRRDSRTHVHFAEPTATEREQAEPLQRRPVPQPLKANIPAGLETRVLRRTGFERWSDLYAPRQLEVLGAAIPALEKMRASAAIKARLRLALCGCAEMAGYASRWDRYYPKAFEVVANHRFAITGLSVETNLLAERGRGTLPRRLGHSVRAARWVGEELPPALTVSNRSAVASRTLRPKGVVIAQGSSESQRAASGSIDLVLTDPPYFDDVQYAELAAVFLTWANAVGLVPTSAALDLSSEAVVNSLRGTGAERYCALLTAILTETRRTLACDGLMILTYHNSDMRAWWALGSALRDADFTVAALAVTHAENERDHAKRGRLAFTRDLVLECRADVGNRFTGPEVAWEPDADEAKELIAAGCAIAAMPAGETCEEFRERFRALRGDLQEVRIGYRRKEKSVG
jgi:putative DNA methylase